MLLVTKPHGQQPDPANGAWVKLHYVVQTGGTRSLLLPATAIPQLRASAARQTVQQDGGKEL